MFLSRRLVSIFLDKIQRLYRLAHFVSASSIYLEASPFIYIGTFDNIENILVTALLPYFGAIIVVTFLFSFTDRFG